MKLKFKTCPIGEIKTVADTTVDNPFDFDLTLPDYFPDIQRVLKCIVTPSIANSSVSMGRVTADGNALIRVIYSADDKRIYCYEQTFNFSKSIEDGLIDSGMSLMTTVKTDFVNCRATGQRRLNIQGGISMHITVKCRFARPVICGCEDEMLQTKQQSLDALNTVDVASKSFSMSEVVKLFDNADSVDKILNISSCIITDNIKAVSGKILVKGDLITEIVYSTESDPSASSVYRHSMPISQIFDVQGANESTQNNVFLKVSDISVLTKSDSNDNKNQLEINVRIDASIITEDKSEFEIITDAYSMDGELKCKFENIRFKNITDKVSDNLTVNETIQLNNDGITSLAAMWSNGIKQSVKVKNNELIVNGTVNLVLLYVNNESLPSCVEKEVEFEYVKKLMNKAETVIFEPVVQVSGCKGSQVSDNSVNAKVEILIEGNVYSCFDKRLLSEADLNDEIENDKMTPLVIYFAEESEDVWDVARKYKTTTETIKTENGFTEDTLESARMLIITSAK